MVGAKCSYNIVHPNNKPDPEYIKSDFPLCFTGPTSNDGVYFLDELDLEYESPNKEFHDAAEEVSDSQDKYVPPSPLAGMTSGPTTYVGDSNHLAFLKTGKKSATNSEIKSTVLITLSICLKYCFMLIQAQM